MRLVILILVLMLAATLSERVTRASEAIDYPSNYRSWQHLKSMIIQPGHPLEEPFGGIHHIYANTKAFSGLTSGEYESGAIFVFDLLEYVERDKTIVEADRKRIDVMHYDPSRFAATGGWGFDTFVGNSKVERVEQDVVSACFSCHQSAEASSFVFSQYRR